MTLLEITKGYLSADAVVKKSILILLGEDCEKKERILTAINTFKNKTELTERLKQILND